MNVLKSCESRALTFVELAFRASLSERSLVFNTFLSAQVIFICKVHMWSSDVK